MDRKIFLLMLTKATASITFCSSFQGCDNESDIISPPFGVDFTLDLNDPSNSALLMDGGFIYRNGIIIVNIGNNIYIAFQQACSHQGTTLKYEHSNNRFHCPNHGSNFSTDGIVQNGPAVRNLKEYKIEINGNILRIFD
jgi:cytochrome b6-f complex iron-sulfur subunit